MNRRFASFAAAFALAMSCSFLVAAPDKSTEADQALIKNVTPSLAVAEVTVQTDNGEEPYGAGWGARCPNCGQVHGSSVSEFVEEERPLEMPAFMVGPDLAVMPDPMMQDRFLKSIKVRQGDEVVNATITKYFINQRAVLVKLEKPLKDAKALQFEAGDTKDLKTIVYAEGNGRWNVTASGFTLSVTQTPAGPRVNSVTKDSLIVAPSGKARALVFSDSLPLDNTWMGSPLDWKGRSPEEQKALTDKLAGVIKNGIVRVHLGFRSPPANANEQMRFSRGGDDSATERDVHGIAIAPNRVLVLATLKPTVTARLERVNVFTADGTNIAGKFVASLKDYSALVIETEKPLPQVIKAAAIAPDALVGPALTIAEVRIAGENRTDYISRVRLSGLNTGWRKNLYPEVTLSGDQLKSGFVFDDQANLVALPLMIRPKPKGEDSYGSDSPKLTFAQQLASVIADPAAAADTNNVPLSEEEQNRLAWLGVELQPLTAELARLNKVSQLTKDGETGALVTFVYPDSPAAKAGIEVGAVLLRLHAPEQPQPIDIEADEYMFAEREFPWQQYDQFPEAYFDRMPHPWPTIATTVAKTLTEIGIGKQVTVELFQGGSVQKKQIDIAQVPAYYDSAKKVKHAPSGLTVRPMTFEVRRYFQIQPEAPGVLISGIEPGSRGSKAGLKPYEFVTQVNGKPVKTAEEFLKAAEGQTELRLDVTRMNKSRVVKLKVDEAPATQPAGGAATQPATAPAAVPMNDE